MKLMRLRSVDFGRVTIYFVWGVFPSKMVKSFFINSLMCHKNKNMFTQSWNLNFLIVLECILYQNIMEFSRDGSPHSVSNQNIWRAANIYLVRMCFNVYCIQGYFSPMINSPYYNFKRFRPVLNSPWFSCVIREIYFRHWNSPSLN